MTKNSESKSRTKTGQTETVHDVDKVNYEVILQNCMISKQTANFLACVMALHDLYGNVSDALIKMYGDEQADVILSKKFDAKFNKVESVLYGFFNQSVKDNIFAENLNEIWAMKPKEKNTLATSIIEKCANPQRLLLPDCPSEIQSILEFLVSNQTPVTFVFNIANNNVGESNASNICLLTGDNIDAISGHPTIYGKTNNGE